MQKCNESVEQYKQSNNKRMMVLPKRALELRILWFYLFMALMRAFVALAPI